MSCLRPYILHPREGMEPEQLPEFLPGVKNTTPDIPPWPRRGVKLSESLFPVVERSAGRGLPSKQEPSATLVSRIDQMGACLEPDRTFKVARVRVGPKVSGQKSSPTITAVVILPGAPFPFPLGMWPRHDARTPPKSRHTAVSQPAHVPSEPHLSNRIDQQSSNSCRRK